MGYTVLVHIIHNEEGYEKIKECYYNKTISGGIFIGQNDGDEYIKAIIEKGYKVVLVDQSINVDDPIYNKCMIVNADNFNGAYNATKYLIDKNHTQIAHITGETTKLSSNDRVRGYKKALEDAGIPVNKNLIVNSEFVEKGGYDAVKKLFSKDIKFTAIFASNDKIAFGAVKAIREEGLKVPDDVSIIGFDDIESTKYFNPPLTSIRMELFQMAELSTKSIIESIENDVEFSANYVVPVTLIERKSCKEL